MNTKWNFPFVMANASKTFPINKAGPSPLLRCFFFGCYLFFVFRGFKPNQKKRNRQLMVHQRRNSALQLGWRTGEFNRCRSCLGPGRRHLIMQLQPPLYSCQVRVEEDKHFTPVTKNFLHFSTCSTVDSDCGWLNTTTTTNMPVAVGWWLAQAGENLWSFG